MQVTFVFEKNYFEFRLNRLSEGGAFEEFDTNLNSRKPLKDRWNIEEFFAVCFDLSRMNLLFAGK
jgi:hypothetical protein